MECREERLLLNMLRRAARTPSLPLPSTSGARALPPAGNPILPRFALALKTHLRTHRLLARVKSSSRSVRCQELPAASARQEGSKVQETPGGRLTDPAPARNRAPFVPNLPASAIRRGELRHTPLPSDCSPPAHANTKIKARLPNPTRWPAPLRGHAPSFPTKPSPLEKG